MATCQRCEKEFHRADLSWAYRFGYPFQLVCDRCRDIINEESEHMEFDPSFAGERLEDDY